MMPWTYIKIQETPPMAKTAWAPRICPHNPCQGHMFPKIGFLMFSQLKTEAMKQSTSITLYAPQLEERKKGDAKGP